MAFRYDMDTFGRRRPPAHPEATKHEGIAFNALPPGARQALVAVLDGATTLPITRAPHAHVRHAAKLLLAAAGALLLGLVAVLFQVVNQRVPYVLPWVPVHALVVGAPLYAFVSLLRIRLHGPVFPYRHGRAFLITARDLVWLEGDRLTVIPFDPGALYVRDVPGAKATYVVMQLGATPHPADVAVAGGGSRDEAVQALVAVQQDLREKRAAVDAALARGDVATAGALDPLFEAQGRLAQLAQASRDFGPPAAQGPAAVIYQPLPPPWLRRPLPFVGAAALVGGLCLAAGSMVVCDQLLYARAASSGEHAAFRDYDAKGRLSKEDNRTAWAAANREVLEERLKAARTNAEKRAVWEKFLADFQGTPLQAEVEDLLRNTPPR